MSKPKNFANLFDTYRQNVYPAMLEFLAEDLGVSANSLIQLGVGYEFAGPSWIFAERDDKGKIVGLVRRFLNGGKCTEEDSKRGLTYAINPNYGKGNDRYIPGKHNWVRCRSGLACPICKREKWCMVSSEDIDNPPAVICGEEEGSLCPQGEGTFLHILRPEGIKTGRSETVLLHTELPILIVEGQTDVVAAADLGVVAIGRPSAQGGLKLLSKMPLHNRKVAVIGENDAGVGKTGMESAYQTIRKQTAQITRLTPPDGIKDLRDWIRSGLTKDLLLAKIDIAPVAPAADIFEDDFPQTIAKAYKDAKLMQDGVMTLWKYEEEFYEHIGSCYRKISKDDLYSDINKFVRDKSYLKTDVNGVVTVARYRSTKPIIDNIINALTEYCVQDRNKYRDTKPAYWLDDKEHPNPKDLMPFQNGMFDTSEYLKGNLVLHKSTPAFFNLNTFPYDFDETLESKMWGDYLNDIFNNDQDKINLLAEFFGYCCTTDVSLEKMMMFVGLSGSGKSTVISALEHVVGATQRRAVDFKDLDGNFGVEHLQDGLIAIVGEGNSPHPSKAAGILQKLLQVVGRDTIGIRQKYKHTASARIGVKFIAAANELPIFDDHSGALQRRLLLLQFTNSYTADPDVTLKDQLDKEADDGKLINWALRGLKRLQEHGGKFTQPESSTVLLSEFKALSTPLHEFLKEVKDYGKNDPATDCVDVELLFDMWSNWANSNKVSVESTARFVSRLKTDCSLVVNEDRTKGSRHRVVRKLKVTNEAMQQYT